MQQADYLARLILGIGCLAAAGCDASLSPSKTDGEASAREAAAHAAAAAEPAPDTTYGDKISRRALAHAYSYRTSFRTVADAKSLVEDNLPALVGGLHQGGRVRWQRDAVGIHGEAFGSSARAMTRVYDNGYFLINFDPLNDGGSATAAATPETKPDMPYFVAQAFALARSFGMLANDPACFAGDAPSGGWLQSVPADVLEKSATCPYADVAFAEQSRDGQHPLVYIYIDRRLPFGDTANGEVVRGGLRGAGFRVVFDGPQSIASLEGRPLNVEQDGIVAGSSLLSPLAALDAARDVVRQEGFDPLGLLTRPSVYGYSTQLLPVDSSALASASLKEHTGTVRSDYLPLPDPTLPAPRLRPSYLFGGNATFMPVEPIALPADAQEPRIVQIAPLFEGGQIVAYRTRISPLAKGVAAPTVAWSTVTADGQRRPLGEGELFKDFAQIGFRRPLVAELIRTVDGRPLVVHAAMVETPDDPAAARHDMNIPDQAPSLATTDLTTPVVQPGTQSASTTLTPHLDVKMQVKASQLLPGNPVDFVGNYEITTTIDSLYSASVKKVKSFLPPPRSTVGPIADRIAITHWGMAFEYSDDKGGKGSFQTDLCRLDPRKDQVVCAGGFGKALNTPVEQKFAKANQTYSYYIDQTYDLDLETNCSHRLGVVGARTIIDPSYRPDGGPSLSPGPGAALLSPAEEAGWFASKWLFGEPIVAKIPDLATGLGNYAIKSFAPEIAARLFLLGRTRPAVTNVVYYTFKPSSTLTVGDLAVFCKALGTNKLPIDPGVDGDVNGTNPYCTGPAVASGADTSTAKVTVSKIQFFSEQETVPSYPSLNMLVRENRSIPAVDASLGDIAASKQTMTNTANVTDLIVQSTLIQTLTMATNTMFSRRPLPVTATVAPRMYHLRPGDASTDYQGGPAAWDNIHMKESDRTATGLTSRLLVPGNIIVPGCSGAFPYWIDGEPAIAPLPTPGSRAAFYAIVQKWRYAWDPKPNCIHRHSNWAEGSAGNGPVFWDKEIYRDVKWSFVKRDYAGNSAKDYRPVTEGMNGVSTCTKYTDVGHFNPPYSGDSPEDAYVCEPTKLVETEVSSSDRGGLNILMHATPTFFTE